MSLVYVYHNIKERLPYVMLGVAVASPRLAVKMAEIAFRIGYMAIGEQIRTGAGSAKVIYEVAKRPRGAKMPPLIPAADKVAIRAAAGRAATQGKVAATRLGATTFRLMMNPLVLRTTGIVGGSYVAGKALGSSEFVQTAPPERGQPGLMMGVF